MSTRFWLTIVAAVLSCLTSSAALTARADDLPPDERAFFDKHISKVIQIEPERLRSDAVDRVFRAAFYRVTVTIDEGEHGKQMMGVVVARDGDELVTVAAPGTTEDLPRLKAILNPKFKLRNQQDAKTLEAALDVLYPISKGFGDKDLKAKAIKRSGKDWVFVRGEFFEKHAGFVVTADATGTVQSVKYSLELP